MIAVKLSRGDSSHPQRHSFESSITGNRRTVSPGRPKGSMQGLAVGICDNYATLTSEHGSTLLSYYLARFYQVGVRKAGGLIGITREMLDRESLPPRDALNRFSMQQGSSGFAMQ
jgi:hypothetical protein